MENEHIFSRARLNKKQMKNEIIIHVGSAKTGSTSLHEFLTGNHRFLEEQGICYPKAGRYAALDHFHLFSSMCPEVWYAAQSPGTFEEEWNPVVEELNAAFGSGARFGLLSCSGFLRLKQEQLIRIRDLLGRYQVRIVCYLRRQDRLLMSAVSQGIKAGNPEALDIQSGLEYYSYLLDFEALLAPFEEVFGIENMQILPFEKQQMVKGDATQNFFSKVFNLDLSGKVLTEFPTENVGITRDSLEYVIKLNQLRDTAIDRKKYQAMFERYSTLQRNHHDGDSNDVPILSPRQQMTIIEKYENCNKTIAEKYLQRPDKKLFYDPLPEIDLGYEPYQGLTPSKCVEMADFLIGQVTRELQQNELMPTAVFKPSISPKKTRIVRLIQSLRKQIS